MRHFMHKQSTNEQTVGIDNNDADLDDADLDDAMGSNIRFTSRIKPKNDKNYANPNAKIYSDIKLQPEQEKEFDINNFIEDQLNMDNEDIDRNVDHQIHKDAERGLEKFYDDPGLTIVPEEASVRDTVILDNNLSKRFSQFPGFANNSGFPNNSDFPVESNTFNSKYSQPPREKSNSLALSQDNRFMMSSEIIGGTKNNLSPLYNKSTRSKRNTTVNMKLIKEQKSTTIEELKDDGNMILNGGITRVSSEGAPTFKYGFMNKSDTSGFKLNTQNSLANFSPMKTIVQKNDGSSIRTLNPCTSAFKGINANSFELYELPEFPEEPDYIIDVLNTVKCTKVIRKKEALVDEIYFKIAEDGPFYAGSLRYGKLYGQGALALKMIDLSDLESPEVKKNLLYKGEFNNNVVEGKGTLYFKDGGIFEGTFQNGKAHGIGKLIRKNKEVISEIWISGKMNM